MLTPADVRAALRRYWLIMAAVMLPGVVLLLAVVRSSISPRIGHTGTDASRALSLLAPLVIFAAIMLPVIFYVQRVTLAKCPECGKPIYPKQVDVVIATGACANCGAQIIDRQSSNNRWRGP
jgi:predicted RNA-binding Zn-ribbon protein involved in translation (DUF1610 family)